MHFIGLIQLRESVVISRIDPYVRRVCIASATASDQ
jgi:hypothetical protein